MASYAYTFTSGDTVTPTKLNNARTVSAIQTADISDAQITEAKLADASVSNVKLASGIDASKLTTGTLPIARIADGAVTPAKLSQSLTLATAQNATSGTSIDFTGIPSWAKRITVMLNEVSTNGTAHFLLQLGDSGGIENSGYVANSVTMDSGGNTAGTTSTGGFVLYHDTAAQNEIGTWTIANVAGNTWIASHTANKAGTNATAGSGNKTLSSTLDRVRLTTANGTDTFDAGSVNIMYEG